MKFCAVVLALAFAACHSDTPVQEPGEKAPLPSSSGTPIGYLIDGAGELRLRDDQVAKLRDIDTGLTAELGGIDAKLRAANKDPDQGSNSNGKVHMRGGGMGRNGMGGRNRAMMQQGSGDPHRAAVATGLTDQRAAEVEQALHRAFGVLDADQREPAKKVLSDHDIDYDDSDDAAPAGPPQPVPPPAGQSGEP